MSLSSVNLSESRPFTPLDQTLKTPVEPPPNHEQQLFSFPQQVTLKDGNNSIYLNAKYIESDDILADIDDPSFGISKTTKNYTLNFTPIFDKLLLSVYSHILSLPTTTPFLGNIPPSGLLSKVANITMNKLLENISNNNNSLYDYQTILNYDYLKNYSYHPIFLQLFRKRLIDLCAFNNSTTKLPNSTTISITISNSNIKQSSISNLSLTDLNVSNYNQNSQNRPKASLNLRKKLTKNNSCNGNNWLHVGNLSNIKPQNRNGNSSDSLQSMQDFVPQILISRSTINENSLSSIATPTNSNNGFNSMMTGYQSPLNSNKNLTASVLTPPRNIQATQSNNVSDLDDFNFFYQNQRSILASRGNSLPNTLIVNTEIASSRAINALNDNSSPYGETLDSPFMSTTTPSEDYNYSNSFLLTTNISDILIQESQSYTETKPNLSQSNLSQYSLSEKKRESFKLKRGIR